MQEARVSALAEAVERYSATWHGDEHQIVGCLDDLPQGLHPNDCMRFSQRQYASRVDDTGPQHDRFQWVPEEFDPAARLAWTRVWSLTGSGARLLPSAYLYFGFEGPGGRFCRADSNGLAAGNCLEEAVVHGFLELVERDAVALWWYNRTMHPSVDLNDVSDPYVLSVRRRCESTGRSLWVLDITSDLAVPCFVAVSHVKGQGDDRIALGFGAHFNEVLAVRRALCELGQGLAWSQGSELERDHPLAARWLREAKAAQLDYIRPDPHQPLRPLGLTGSRSLGIADEVEWCITIARRAGLEVFVQDLSRADAVLQVARVIVPGLRHVWRRLGPGRLYDVPVSLGRIESPHDELELNPWSAFW